MGGDGGVIASNRKYMRGAGTADHTADASRKVDEKASPEERMRTCHLTKAPLQLKEPIVACSYGRLYSKEAAVEALLRRKQSGVDELGSHIRGLKDMYAVKFHLAKDAKGSEIPVCPVTGVELLGKHPALLISSNKGEEANVISERAVKEMGMESLQAEYGPFDTSDLVRLAPPESMMEEIRQAVETKQQSSKGKKRKKQNADIALKKIKSQNTSLHRKGSVADAARKRVVSAVASNEVLSSLFASTTGPVSEKEKNDNLFAR